jgi:O-antigen/teichoic acid export membrane protein
MHEATAAGRIDALSRRIGGSTLWSATAFVFVGNTLARGLGFLFPIVLAHSMGRDDFALVYLFINMGFFTGELVLTGFPTAMARQIASEKVPSERGAWVPPAVLGGLPLLAVSIVAAEALAAAANAPAGLTALVVVGLSIDAYYFSVLRGLEEFALLGAYRSAAALFQLVLLVAVVVAGAVSVKAVVIIYSFVYLVPIAVIEVARRPVFRTLASARRATRPIRGLLRYAIPSLIMGLSYGAIFGLDVFFIRLGAPEALPDYLSARTLVQPMTLIPFAITVVLLPKLTRARAEERTKLLGRSMFVTAAVAVIGGIAYFTIGPAVIEFVFPSSYSASPETMGILALAVGLLGVYSVLTQWWVAIGHPLRPAFTLSAGAAATAVLQLVLTPELGSTGAALAIGGGVALSLLVIAPPTLRRLQAS